MWDGAEVKKIVQTALWVLDRLELVQGSKSMRSLVICFGVRIGSVFKNPYIHIKCFLFEKKIICRVFLRP